MNASTHDLKTALIVAAIAQEITATRRVPPVATYRVQLNHTFRFTDARHLVGYLDALGVSDLYVSPVFQARPGSMHGYDITDHRRLNPELGSADDFDRLAAALRERDMGLVLDMVPNHMGIGDPSNSWWMDVLENGPGSPYAGYFDIDWQPINPALAHKVLLPILDDQYGRALEAGKLRLAYADGAFRIELPGGNWLPVAPGTYDRVLQRGLPDLVAALDPDHEVVIEYQSILTAIHHLPPRNDMTAADLVERTREKEVIKRRIRTLAEREPATIEAIDQAVRSLNGTVGQPESFDGLDDLLNAQPYRPAFWRVASEEINYRRFFDINDLAAIRVERPEVFQATHGLLFDLLGDGRVTGLRIDHPDGLWNPPAYFHSLQRDHILRQVAARLPDADPDELADAIDAWFGAQAERPDLAYPNPPLYVVAEKILSPGEAIPESWAVHGTTGYDALAALNGLFVDGRNESAFTDLYCEFIGRRTDFHGLTTDTREMILRVSMASELNALAHGLDRLSERNRHYRDFTLNGLTVAIRELLASLPAYRTYLTDLTTGPTEQDIAWIEAAVEQAKQRNPRTAASLFDFFGDLLLLRNIDDFPEAERGEVLGFIMKFQQLSGPVMAKGVEDTAYYTYHRLTSLNEVGGEPARFGTTPTEFHDANRRRAERWPHSMLTLSTHDTKRSADVRARLNGLSEQSGPWREALASWHGLNAGQRDTVAGRPVPDRNTETLLYQTLLGVWPLDLDPTQPDAAGLTALRERVGAYLTKAEKEAKVHTSWINPNTPYDRALQVFLDRVLDPSHPFLSAFAPMQRRLAYSGHLTSLSQQLLLLTMPGVPDIYQGSELWDLSLVDPDNRRPVDYARREQALVELRQRIDAGDDALPGLVGELLDSWTDGRIKLYLIHRALGYRRRQSGLFATGAYEPLAAVGAKAEHVVAFARRCDDAACVVVSPRLVATLTEAGDEPRRPVGAETWADTWLPLPGDQPGQRYCDVLTGRTLTVSPDGAPDGSIGLPLSDILAVAPLALLERL